MLATTPLLALAALIPSITARPRPRAWDYPEPYPSASEKCDPTEVKYRCADIPGTTTRQMAQFCDPDTSHWANWANCSAPDAPGPNCVAGFAGEDHMCTNMTADQILDYSFIYWVASKDTKTSLWDVVWWGNATHHREGAWPGSEWGIYRAEDYSRVSASANATAAVNATSIAPSATSTVNATASANATASVGATASPNTTSAAVNSTSMVANTTSVVASASSATANATVTASIASSAAAVDANTTAVQSTTTSLSASSSASSLSHPSVNGSAIDLAAHQPSEFATVEAASTALPAQLTQPVTIDRESFAPANSTAEKGNAKGVEGAAFAAQAEPSPSASRAAAYDVAAGTWASTDAAPSTTAKAGYSSSVKEPSPSSSSSPSPKPSSASPSSTATDDTDAPEEYDCASWEVSSSTLTKPLATSAVGSGSVTSAPGDDDCTDDDGWDEYDCDDSDDEDDDDCDP